MNCWQVQQLANKLRKVTFLEFCSVLCRGALGGEMGVWWDWVCVCVYVCVNVVCCQVRVGVRGSIFISGCQGGDSLMNGAE